jgi:hypothetical protein
MDRNAHIYDRRTKRRDFKRYKLKLELVCSLLSCLIHSYLAHQIYQNWNYTECGNMTEMVFRELRFWVISTERYRFIVKYQ